ncbi:unnamed protein product, partial [Didymodactylos carnosus]
PIRRSSFAQNQTSAPPVTTQTRARSQSSPIQQINSSMVETVAATTTNYHPSLIHQPPGAEDEEVLNNSFGYEYKHESNRSTPTNNQQNSPPPSVSQPSTSQPPAQPSSSLPSQQEQQPSRSYSAPAAVNRPTTNRGSTLRRVITRGRRGLNTQQRRNTSLSDASVDHQQQQQTRT